MPGVSDPVRIVDEDGNEISPANPLNVTGTFTGTITGTSDVNLIQVSGVAVTLGQKLSAASIPVVLSSDDKPQVNLTQVGGTGINIGQGAMNQSVPVVIANNQSAISVNATIVGVPSTKDAGPSQTITRMFTAHTGGGTNFDLTGLPVVGEYILLLDLLISVDTACLVQVQMEATGNVLAGFYMPAQSTLQITPRGYIKADQVDRKLLINLSVASDVQATAIYTSEA